LFLGKFVKIRSGTKIYCRKKSKIIISDDVFLNHNIIITAHECIEIGSGTQIGPNVMIFDHDHIRLNNKISSNQYLSSKITIGKNVLIGAGTIILKGSFIGDNCTVGAGSIISGRYENNTVIIQKRTIV
jgi:acetyltransferase-like isoleucine patch superfamily enzyme